MEHKSQDGDKFIGICLTGPQFRLWTKEPIIARIMAGVYLIATYFAQCVAFIYRICMVCLSGSLKLSERQYSKLCAQWARFSNFL